MAKTILEEKRRYTRIIFNECNKVQAVIILPGVRYLSQQVSASVLNMSEGGIQISIERKKYQEMQEGDRVLLSSLKGIPDLQSLIDIPVEVVWIMNNKYLEHILLGMSFAILSGKQRETLRFFIENRLALGLIQEAEKR
jgi:c-di-GMP-binding flagellar brake protein YcgR